ncbi:MAG: hypothetical protein JEZ07_13175 [Phycisphaerae bacterium]|nr:hypothetical protein [Phycisphaerae bacterium]
MRKFESEKESKRVSGIRKGLVKSLEEWHYSNAAVWEKLRNDPADIDRDQWPA